VEGAAEGQVRRAAFPILEFDPARRPVIDPARLVRRVRGFPSLCVPCFLQDVLRDVVRTRRAPLLTTRSSEFADHRVHRIVVRGVPVAIFHPGVGGARRGMRPAGRR
jgi:hypothetical protein